MSYNTVATFKIRAFPSGSFNELTDAEIQPALDSASSLINAALRVHHTLPMLTGSFAAELDSLYDAEIAISSYRLMQFRGFKPNIAGSFDEVLSNRYAEIMDPEDGFLAQIRKGQVTFPSEADSTAGKRDGRTKMFGKTGRTTRNFDSDGKEFIGI